MNERWKKLFTVSPFKIAVLVILIALVLFFIDVPFIRFMELKALDLRMVSRGGTAPGGETVIATIDEKSLSELGRWPWPRTTIARLIDTLAANGAKVVGLDIVFAEPDAASGMKIVGDLSKEIKDSGIADARILGLLEKRRALADTDAVLARSIEKAKSVILSYFFHIHRSDIGHLTDREIAAGQENIESSRIPMIRKTKGAGRLTTLISPMVPAMPTRATDHRSDRISEIQRSHSCQTIASRGPLRCMPCSTGCSDETSPSRAAPW